MLVLLLISEDWFENEGSEQEDDGTGISSFSIWLAYFLMFLGWFLFIRGMLDYVRIRQVARQSALLASVLLPLPTRA